MANFIDVSKTADDKGNIVCQKIYKITEGRSSDHECVVANIEISYCRPDSNQNWHRYTCFDWRGLTRQDAKTIAAKFQAECKKYLQDGGQKYYVLQGRDGQVISLNRTEYEMLLDVDKTVLTSESNWFAVAVSPLHPWPSLAPTPVTAAFQAGLQVHSEHLEQLNDHTKAVLEENSWEIGEDDEDWAAQLIGLHNFLRLAIEETFLSGMEIARDPEDGDFLILELGEAEKINSKRSKESMYTVCWDSENGYSSPGQSPGQMSLL